MGDCGDGEVAPVSASSRPPPVRVRVRDGVDEAGREARHAGVASARRWAVPS